MPNITAEDMNRKTLSSYPHTEKWSALNTDVSLVIGIDDNLKYWTPMVPDNEQTKITNKQNFSQIFEREFLTEE